MNLQYRELSDTPDDLRSLTSFLKQVDTEFQTPLSNKISLEVYGSKLLKGGKVIAYCDNDTGNIISANCFYCNDIVNKTGYISMLCSLPEARGNGIARELIIRSLNISRENGMNCVAVNSVNPIAIHLYKSVGFKEIAAEGKNGIQNVSLNYTL